MADTTTTILGLTKPEVTASNDTWGTKLNADLDALDALFQSGPALKVVNGGTGATTAANARTNLGLGSMATQAASGVAITGGSIVGITDLAIADGGTGASDAPNARANLGLGTAAVLNVGTAANNIVQLNGSAQLPAVDGSLLTNLLPSGLVLAFAGSAAPSGWLLCSGAAVSRTTYAALFAAIGTTYGAGDGTTTFNLPDLRGRVPAGKDNMDGTAAGRLSTQVTGTTLGASGGAETHTLDTTQIPSHSHTATFSRVGVNTSGSSNPANNFAATGLGNSFTTDVTGGGLAHNNVQPTLVLNYIIKV